MDRFETAFRAAVHFMGYAMVWAMLALFVIASAAGVASGVACKINRSLAVCVMMEDATATIRKRDLENSKS